MPPGAELFPACDPSDRPLSVISGRTRLVGLLGHPVSGSLSPRMQNAAFAALALDWAYVPLDVEPSALEAAVAGLRALGFGGANVTIPHKTAVLPLCDEVDDVATRAGSVNTLLVRDGSLLGSSTDGAAVTGAVEAAGADALVLGAGGAARAAVAALRDAGAARVRIAARDRKRAEALGEAAPWPPDASEATLVVNATPIRDEPLVALRADQQVVDLVYRPDGAPTALVVTARAAGCLRVVDGLEVLVRQGAASFERWTGLPAPVEVMRRALVS
jgi:shikimate dehydrogenase